MEKKQVFSNGTFTLGVNYWASHKATRMWSEWDESVVEADFKNLAAIGCKVLRVFPLWSDFQPVMVLRSNCHKGGYRYAYAFTGERPLPNTEAGRAGVDEVMMEHFEKLCDLAEKYNMKLIVPLITGHMTFRIYNPPAVDGLDHFTDPESLMWQGKFIRYFVKRMKNHPAIIAWELGNECNCLSAADGRSAAWSWTAFVTNAVRAEDNTRPICSGMHSLSLHPTKSNPASSSWSINDQAELCDSLTSHPYPIWSDYVNCDKPNTLRWSLLAAIENQMYADISDKECFAEEVGTLRRTFSTFDALGDQLRNILWNLWSNDSRALLWWCAFDQTGMEFPPYDWDEAGMEHGVMTADYKLNPTGKAMRDFSEFLDKCPVKVLPQVREKAVCILGKDQSVYEIVNGTGVLARQAGLPLKFAYSENEIPDANVYLIPSAVRKGALNRSTYKKLWEKVENGATVYMSFSNNICIPQMDEYFGIEIESREKSDGPINIELKGIDKITVNPAFRFNVKPQGAKQLDKEGMVWEYEYGKGRIISVALPLEVCMVRQKGSFQKYPAFELYKMIGEDILKNNIIESSDCEVITSEHPENDNTVYGIVTNCSPENKKVKLNIKSDWLIADEYSDTDGIRIDNNNIILPANSSALLVLKRKD